MNVKTETVFMSVTIREFSGNNVLMIIIPKNR